MLSPDHFVLLSELGLEVDQICAHFRVNRTEAEQLAQENWQCSASDANQRLRQAGPITLLTRAAERANDGHEKLMMFLLERLWRPPQAPQEGQSGPADVKGLTNDQLTRIYRIMAEGGV